MNKELIDRVWACLPREFKEKVKKKYARCVKIDEDDNPHLPAYAVKSAISRRALLEKLFGEHNLTSDAEGEEMLICEKSKVQRAYNTSREIVKAENPDSLMYSMHTQIMCVLESIFGSKCLPDAHEDNFTRTEPKPSEPKFKIGDELVWDKRILVKIDEVFADGKYLVFSRIGNRYMVKESDLEPYTAAEQPMTDSETEHTKDEFVARMQGKFTEQDLTEARQRTESCVASLSQFELPKQIEAQIDEAMESIKAESRKQFGDFGAANADIAIPLYRQMMRLGALLALSAGDLESEQTDSDRGDYISMTKPTDPNKCTLFWREKGEEI